jgi:hypothetical protein
MAPRAKRKLTKVLSIRFDMELTIGAKRYAPINPTINGKQMSENR